ncbi:MAG TPA: 30S ribosomal protein S2 [Candidatus Kapabacteria bacterium]|nr:30S ribosomal protein S2 [Candidatus Kapabacteria bacterium]
MNIPSILEMLQAGVHFGHQVSRWHPKMKPYIFTQRNGVHVIDLEKTAEKMAETLDVVKQMAAQGKTILFVSTKPQGREIVKQAAIDCGMPFLVERWLGGLLTNFPEIRKLLKKYISLKEQQKNGELERYTKKEQLDIAKELEKMDKNLGGLTVLDKIPDAIFVPAVQREKTAVTEANRMNVPVIGIVDTNANPDKTEYFIPANDDGVHAITMVVQLVADAVKEGRKEWEKKKTEKKEEVSA